MAAQQPPNVAVPHTEYQSEDEDSTVEFDVEQFPDVEDPVVVLQADPALKRQNWRPRDASGWEQYIPDFTRPGYDDAIEVKGDGSMERPRIGGPINMMRPAILPTDPAASQYARRFGIFPDRKLNENSEARSMMTPVFNPTADPRLEGVDFQWGIEESFQATCFEYFTTQELADTGVFDPNQVVHGPDAQGALHHLLARDKWTQEPLTRSTIFDDDQNLGLDFWYNLNGEKRPWDVQQNDELWDALQPALQLASRVLLSEHPFWNAVLSVYHMRPVPVEKDGRTELEKADPTYRPYVSIWYDIDRDKMYPAARALMDQKFDSTAATLEILTRLLRFSVARSDSASASASTRLGGFEPENRSIRIVINANNIWPLLVPEYSVSEKIAVSFYVAKLILHELAHAARNSVDYILIFPDMLEEPRWTPPEGTAFNQDIRNGLRSLCFEAFKLPPMEVFFQDVPQLEEGKSFEHQLFGFDAVYAPMPPQGRHNDAIRPVIGAVVWPWRHPVIHLQNRKSVEAGLYDDYTRDGYQTFLLDPPASAYDLYTALPVSSYAKFMHESWWNDEYMRFGHQALKIPIHSMDPSSPFKTVVRQSDAFADFASLLTPVIRSRAALAFLVNYAMPQLVEHQQISIMNYLALLTRDVASAKVMRNRLHYEKRTWPNRLRGIREMGEKVTESFNTTWDALTEVLRRRLSRNTQDDVDEVIMEVQELVGHLTELNRLLGIEVQYSQALAALYVLKTPEARRKIHRRYMRFLQANMVQMRNSIAYVVETIASSHEQDGRRVWKTLTAPWEMRLDYMLETDTEALNALSDREAEAVNDAIDGLRKIRQFTRQACDDLLTTSSHLENVLRILDEQYVDYPIATAPTGLFPGVPVAMQMMELSKVVEKRALYEMIRLKNPGLDQIIQQWIKILHTHAGLSERVRRVGATVHWERVKAEIRAVTIVLFQAKRREVEPGGPTYDGRHPRDLLVDAMRGQVMLMLGDHEPLRPWLREVCIEEQDEEEFHTIMRMVYQRPAPQEPAPQEPAPQEPAPQEPAPQEPASQGPAIQEPASQEPASQGTSSQEPASQGPSSQGPSSQGPSSQGPASQGPASQGPASQEPASQGPETQGPATQEPASQGRASQGSASQGSSSEGSIS